MLGECYFFKLWMYIEIDNILWCYLIVENKDDCNKFFYNCCIVVVL